MIRRSGLASSSLALGKRVSSASRLSAVSSPSSAHNYDEDSQDMAVGTNMMLDRRQILAAMPLSLGIAVTQTTQPVYAAEDKIPWGDVRKDLAKVISADANRGPTLLRLAWHSSGTYSPKTDVTGGSEKGTIRYAEELAHGANAGLSPAVNKWLAPIHKKYEKQGLQWADLITLGGVVGVAELGGPEIPWRAGRKDAASPDEVPPEGRLPAADKGSFEATNSHLRKEVFYRMGFNDRDIVALSGAHTLGRCHADASGYEGPWTSTPTKMTNGYFVLLEKAKWEPTEVPKTGNKQYNAGELMMLPSDIALTKDKKFAPIVHEYATNQEVFFTDFAKAASKLFELGTVDLYEVSFNA